MAMRETPGGVLTGSDPTPPPDPQPDPTPPNPNPPPAPPPTAPAGDPGQQPESRFSSEDIERARREEKDKLYPEMQRLREELEAIRAEREKETEAQRKAREKQEAEDRKKAEDEMSAKELIASRETQWAEERQQMEARLNDLAAQRERDLAVLEQERRLNELSEYRSRRIGEEGDDIIPQLRDLVTGNSPDEIEASIASLKERSVSILEAAAQASGGARQPVGRGPSVTQPPVGPMDMGSASQDLSPDDIRGMDLATYAQHRDRLLGAVSQRSKERGLYG